MLIAKTLTCSALCFLATPYLAAETVEIIAFSCAICQQFWKAVKVALILDRVDKFKVLAGSDACTFRGVFNFFLPSPCFPHSTSRSQLQHQSHLLLCASSPSTCPVTAKTSLKPALTASISTSRGTEGISSRLLSPETSLILISGLI